MSDGFFWFAYRQVNEKPYGNVVVEGPFENMDAAERKKGNETDWDMQYMGPFLAESREEAKQRARKYFSSL